MEKRKGRRSGGKKGERGYKVEEWRVERGKDEGVEGRKGS